MSGYDWIGKPKPPTTGAPGFGSERIGHDPRAPRGREFDSQPPTIGAIPPELPPDVPPATGTGNPGCEVQIRLNGGYQDTVTVGDDGTWTWQPPPLQEGQNCISVRQRCAPAGWSTWATECFDVVPPVRPSLRPIDFGAHAVTFLGASGRDRTPGVFAMKIGDHWVHGVLRQAQEARG